MNAIETLTSVLCDPEGKCCISGSDDDRRLIDSALAELAQAAQQASTVTNYTTLGAAMRAIRQSIQMIGDPEDECMRAVKRVLRGAVIIVEDSGDEVAAPAAPAQPDPAYSAACHLATALFKKYFAHLPDFASGQAVWGLCGSTAGVISQIDNMVSGLLQPPTTAFSEDEL